MGRQLTDELSPAEVAKACGVGENTVRRDFEAGKVKGRLVGRWRRIKRADAIAYARRNGWTDGAAKLAGNGK